MQASAGVRANARMAAAVATSKKLGSTPVAGVEHLGEQPGQGLVVDQLAGDPDALVEADEVRAGEGVDLVAARLQRRTEERDGRALAVGSGDMEDGRKPVLRAAEPVEDNGDALESEPVAGGRELGQPVELRLDARMRRAREIRHQAAFSASGAR